MCYNEYNKSITVSYINGTYQIPKEVYIMSNTKKPATENTTKKVAEKKVTAPKTEKAKEVKEKPAKETKTNKEKINVITIQEASDLMVKAGLSIYNPNCKGKYRIIGSKRGSSLNITTKGYFIYSTDEDFKLAQANALADVSYEEGTNSIDKVRPNTVHTTKTDVLVKLLKVYAKNKLNRVQVESGK